MIGRSCLIIAHRLSTIREADRIYVIKDGIVAEEGNHEQLIQMKGEYYYLLNQQSDIY